MRHTEKFNPSMLQNLSGCDFEELSEHGENARLRLCGLVHSALQLPDSWHMDCEMRGEWGGVYPVHLRLTRTDAAGLAVELVSPSECSPVWCAIITDIRSQCHLRLYASDRFDAVVLQEKLLKIVEYTRAGFTGAGELVAAMRMGGHAA